MRVQEELLRQVVEVALGRFGAASPALVRIVYVPLNKVRAQGMEHRERGREGACMPSIAALGRGMGGCGGFGARAT